MHRARSRPSSCARRAFGFARRARSKPVGQPRAPVSVLVVVYTDDARVLLLRRISPFEFWQSVTGSLHKGETPVDAAKRELAEETGLTDEGDLIDTSISRVFTIDPRWRHRYAPGVSENTEHEFRYRLAGTVDIVLAEDEHSAARWLPVDEAIDAVWSSTNRVALEKLKKELR